MHAPYCTGHSVCALSFLCEWLAAEKLRWEEKENTLRGSQATITTGTTSICTHTEDMDDTTEREREKNIPSKPTSPPFGLKYGANMCSHSEQEKIITDLKPHFCLPLLQSTYRQSPQESMESSYCFELLSNLVPWHMEGEALSLRFQ